MVPSTVTKFCSLRWAPRAAPAWPLDPSSFSRIHLDWGCAHLEMFICFDLHPHLPQRILAAAQGSKQCRWPTAHACASSQAPRKPWALSSIKPDTPCYSSCSTPDAPASLVSFVAAGHLPASALGLRSSRERPAIAAAAAVWLLDPESISIAYPQWPYISRNSTYYFSYYHLGCVRPSYLMGSCSAISSACCSQFWARRLTFEDKGN